MYCREQSFGEHALNELWKVFPLFLTLVYVGSVSSSVVELLICGGLSSDDHEWVAGFSSLWLVLIMVLTTRKSLWRDDDLLSFALKSIFVCLAIVLDFIILRFSDIESAWCWISYIYDLVWVAVFFGLSMYKLTSRSDRY